MKPLKDILGGIGILETKRRFVCSGSLAFSSIREKWKPGDLFVAVKGSHVDGHQFIAKAVELGARCCGL